MVIFMQAVGRGDSALLSSSGDGRSKGWPEFVFRARQRWNLEVIAGPAGFCDRRTMVPRMHEQERAGLSSSDSTTSQNRQLNQKRAYLTDPRRLMPCPVRVAMDQGKRARRDRQPNRPEIQEDRWNLHPQRQGGILSAIADLNIIGFRPLLAALSPRLFDDALRRASERIILCAIKETSVPDGTLNPGVLARQLF
ncbi:hypothetical protein EJ069_27315 [Mesorhizobium sp. M2A.F.Ca.ET.043.05.1.1]|uniref:hypothetical protein n=1 Tax=Mesorhizobium sp. M2A.F.Ca.ET.043.05.1.1 TaxID=2493671 RepID=UPI000F7634C4|nr:hypothetical protein [Mesorhizobium sp. M2A.F.Ca.ET.043.05.1.1]AZO18067.1 hypothetical protein EJ069_27315 [Mesorhizobium sp. M2A.F.Ca.ET.043.05.1.1]